MIEILFFSVIGIGLGVATGLIPGLHINNLLPLLLSLAAFIDPYSLASLIISMAIVQIFVGFIPSIFLGAPEADTSLSTLPGHRMLHEGRGFEAINLTVIGGVGSMVVSIVAMLLLSNYFQIFYELSRPYIHIVLICILGFMVVTEKKFRSMMYALLILILSGILGFLVLQSSLVPQQNVLFPTLAGLFGISILVTSIMEKSKIPEQSDDNQIKSRKIDLLKSILLGAVAGMIVGFLPAVGVSQAAAIFQSIGGLGDARSFLVSLSGINAANEIFSLNSVYLIGNPRSGASVAIDRIFDSISWDDLILFVSIAIFATGIGAMASIFLGKRIPKLLAKINYRNLSLGVIALMVFMVFFTTGLYGLLIVSASSSIGILCNSLGVKKSTCMGVLLLPSIFFFAGVTPTILTFFGL